tara:strand:+ start:5789 stop:8356 length:2568 start_codon:yes stop_codon:yes gene_type:complete
MPNTEVNISLKSKSSPVINITTVDSGTVTGSAIIAPTVSFIPTGPRGAVGAKGDNGNDGTAVVAPNSITATEIAPGVITATEIANNSITAGNLAAGAVTNNSIADGAIAASKIADGTITSGKLASGTISSAVIDIIDNNAIDKSKIAEQTLDASTLATDSILTAKVKDRNITGVKIESNPDLDGEVKAHNLKLKGSSPAYIKGPDNDALRIVSNTTIDFQNSTPETIASLDQSGNLQIHGRLDFIENQETYGKIDCIATDTTSGSEDSKIVLSTLYNGTALPKLTLSEFGVESDLTSDLRVYGHIKSQAGPTYQPKFMMYNQDANIQAGELLGEINWFNSNVTNLYIKGVATEDQTVSPGGGVSASVGSKLEFYTTANTTGVAFLAATIDQDKSLILEGDLQVKGNDIKDSNGTAKINLNDSGKVSFNGTVDIDGTLNTGILNTTSAITDNILTNVVNVMNTSGNEAKITIKEIGSHTPSLYFEKTATGADGDDIGKIDFTADNDAGTPISFVQVLAEMADADAGSEEGKLTLSVASHDAEMRAGLVIESGLMEDLVNVTIGSAPNSTTTVVGNLAVNGTVDGIDIATDVAANTAKTSFPGFGTTAGTALEGDTVIPAAYTDADAVSAVAAADNYVKNDSNEVITGSLEISEYLFVVATGGGSKTRFRNASTTTNRTLDIPDADGTLALTSDIPSFTPNPTVIASFSTRVGAYWANRYYFGQASYGWNYYSWNYAQTAKTSINDMYIHNGIMCPIATNTLRIRGSVRNDSNTNDVEMLLFKGSRPNGGTSNVTLTELGATTITISTQDLHYNADLDVTDANVSVGDLLFVCFRRIDSSNTNSTKYINVTVSLYGE